MPGDRLLSEFSTDETLDDNPSDMEPLLPKAGEEKTSALALALIALIRAGALARRDEGA